MVVSTLHITLENNGNVAAGQPAAVAAASVVGAATSPTKFAVLSAQQLQQQLQLQQQQNEKENHMNNNNNNSDYCDMNGNGVGMGNGGSGAGGPGSLSPQSPDQYVGSPVSSAATPQRTASALRRGIQIQRSSTRLRQQQASQ